MAKFKPDSYQALKKTWYKRLKDDGFDDIEANEMELKRSTNEFKRERYTKSWQSKETYYYAANHFLNEYKFESNLDRIIWEYHANGISGRDIAKLLTKVRKKPINRMTVWRIVKRLNVEMKKLYPGIYGQPAKSE